jgi:O-antigen/teichoic acid export membrane protein
VALIPLGENLQFLRKITGSSKIPQGQNSLAQRFLSHLRTPLYRNGYALLINAASTSILGILYWILAARFYTTEAVGINAAAIATMTFLSSAARLYLDGALIRFLPRSGVNATRLILYSYLIGGVSAALVGTVFLLGLDFWAPALGFLGSSSLLAIGFILATIASCIFSQQDGALIGLRQAHWVPVENILFSITKILLLIPLAKLFPEYGIFVSWSIPLLLSLLPVNLLIFKKLLPMHVRENVTPEAGIGGVQVVQYALGLYAGYVFYAASSRLLPLMVLQVAGSSAAAFFTLPWTIMTSLQLAIPSMMGSLTVEASRDQSKLVKYSHQAFLQTARLLTPVILLILIAAPYLLHLFGESYVAEASSLLRLLSLATLPQIISGLYFGIARIRRSVGGVIVVHASLFLMNIGLSYFFLNKFGITGVGIAWLISQSVMALVLFFTQLRPLLWSKEEQQPAYLEKSGRLTPGESE